MNCAPTKELVLAFTFSVGARFIAPNCREMRVEIFHSLGAQQTNTQVSRNLRSA